MRHQKTALAMVMLCAAKTAAWQMAPPEMQGDVWNVSGALFAALALFYIGLVTNSKEVWLAVAIAAGVELQTAACSVAYLIAPWVMLPGDDQCASGLQFPLGLVIGWALICIAIALQGNKNGRTTKS